MSITSTTSFSCLHFITPSYRSHGGRHSFFFPSLQVSGSRQRQHLKVISAGQQDGEQIKISSSTEAGAFDSLLGIFPESYGWFLSPLFLVVIPIWRRIRKAEGILEKADSTVETIEAIAEKVEKMAEDIAEDLPDGARMKKVVLKVSNVADQIGEGAEILDKVIDKITDSIDELEGTMEEAEKKMGETGKAKSK